MVQHPDSISDALMHLFYYQQGNLFDEAPDLEDDSPSRLGLALRREAASHPTISPSQRSGAGTNTMQAHLTTAGSSSPSSPSYASNANIRALQQRRDDLKRRLEQEALQVENEDLSRRVLHMQEEFGQEQEAFQEMKASLGEQLGALDRQLEAQQAVTSAAQKRVICTEDLIRFFEEQRRLMAGHWKAQCQLKDERIRALNLQLTEYTIDWQRLGTQKQTEASLTHELQCLQDRHTELLVEHERRKHRREQLSESLAEMQESEAREEEEARQAASSGQASSNSPRSHVRELEACGAGLRCQLQLLEERRRTREAETQQLETAWPHSCIWRDELDVRERQLEKITSQLDRTNSALHAAQAALASQRHHHEDMKRRHRDAEAELREDERIRVRLKREYLELKRAEADLRKATELQFGIVASGSGVARGEVAKTANRSAVPPLAPHLLLPHQQPTSDRSAQAFSTYQASSERQQFQALPREKSPGQRLPLSEIA
jgi:hypothetical protein